MTLSLRTLSSAIIHDLDGLIYLVPVMMKIFICVTIVQASLLLKDHLSEVPVVLVGNKIDQNGDRMVSSEEGQRRSKEIGCVCFHEISVRESIEQVIIDDHLQTTQFHTQRTSVILLTCNYEYNERGNARISSYTLFAHMLTMLS